jgi:hypothetical protein
MATIGSFSIETLGKGVIMASWADLTTTGAGRALDAVAYPDKTVVLSGTIGSGTTLVIQGSNTATNVLSTGGAWYTLTDQSDNALSLTTGKVETIAQNPRYIRPRITAKNANTNVRVTIVAQSVKR